MLKWIFAIFLGLEDKVDTPKEDAPKADNNTYEKKANNSKQQKVNEQYKTIEKEYSSIKDKVSEKKSLSGKINSGFKNIKNIAKNAFDNTVGYGIAKSQNRKAIKHFNENPDSDSQIVYLKHGLFQNEGSQWRLAKELKKQGKQVYHLKGNHKHSREKNKEKTYKQIEEFHEKAGIKDAHKRNDIYSGHSSGADMGIYMSDNINQYGVKKVQARAPAPSGIKAKTMWQKLLMPVAKGDSPNTQEGRTNAVQLSKVKPKVDIQVIAGKYDLLVTPKDAVYEHANEHYIIDHPDATHFGTSGGNKHINKKTIELMDKQYSLKDKKSIEYKLAT